MKASKKMPTIIFLVFCVLFASLVVGYYAGKQLAQLENSTHVKAKASG